MKPAMALLAVNAAVFVTLRLIAIAIRFDLVDTTIDSVMASLMLPSDWAGFIARPWTIATYMFVQYDALHLIMNMLWLFMFATLLQDITTHRRIYALYLAGGIGGAVVYLLSGIGSGALVGASAAVISIMAAAMVTIPSHPMRLIFFGETSLKIVGLIVILLVVISTGADNYGAHAAHAGGFAAGMALALYWRRKPAKRRTIPVRPIVNRPAETPTASGMQSAKANEAPANDTLDSLLDKIRISGYASLTDDERNRLFKISSSLQNRNK